MPRSLDIPAVDADSALGLWTLPDLARHLGIPLRTVQRWIQTEGLPTIDLSPRQRRVDQDDLLAWLKTRRTVRGGRSSRAGRRRAA